MKILSHETENRVGIEGVKTLAESLKTNSVLTKLVIKGKDIINVQPLKCPE